MGNNTTTTNTDGGTGTETTPSPLETHNQEVYDELIKELKKDYDENSNEYKAIEHNLEQIKEYCDENGLELLDMEDRPEFNYNDGERYGGYTLSSRISFYDPETNTTLNFFDDTLSSVALDNKGTVISGVLDKTVTALRGGPDGFLNRVGVHNVNFTQKNHKLKDVPSSVLGFYNQARPDSIHITPHQLRKIGLGHSDGTDLIMTIIHEGGHAYDANHIGTNQPLGFKVGQPSVFTTYDGIPNTWPTMYSQTVYNTRKAHRYPDPACKSEVISVMCEQVYTKRLRPDALMRDGSTPRQYAENHNIQVTNENQLYQLWADDWSELVTEAEHILYG